VEGYEAREIFKVESYLVVTFTAENKQRQGGTNDEKGAEKRKIAPRKVHFDAFTRPSCLAAEPEASPFLNDVSFEHHSPFGDQMHKKKIRLTRR
jgi:hypothetical protein